MPELIGIGVSTVFGVVAWLLKNKDSAQEKKLEQIDKQISLLFDKHDSDAAALQDLRVQIAAKHYERPELDAKFDKLESTFREGFHDLGAKFDRLSDALFKHMTEDKS